MLRLLPPRRAARCLYEALGVPRHASADDIKSAFRERAKETHPDTADNAAAKEFQELVEAYRVLGDPKRRAKYDQEAAERGGNAGVGGEWPRGFAENCSEEFRANLYGYKVGSQPRGYPGAERHAAASSEADAVAASVWAERAAIGGILLGGMWFFLAPRSKKEDLKDPDPYPSRREPSAALRSAAMGGISGGAASSGESSAASARAAGAAAATAPATAASSSGGAQAPTAEERRAKAQAEKEALGDEVVRAYYNPFANTWHRIPEGYEPPGTMDLTAWHKKRTDPVEWSRLFAEGKLSEIIPRGGLKIRYRPKWDTYEPMLVKDPHTGKTVQVTHKLLPRAPREACEVEF